MNDDLLSSAIEQVVRAVAASAGERCPDEFAVRLRTQQRLWIASVWRGEKRVLHTAWCLSPKAAIEELRQLSGQLAKRPS